MPEKFSSMLRAVRRQRSLSQRELASKVGVHHTYISKLEAGDERPSREVIGSLAVALDIDRMELELAAGYLPAEFAKVIAEREELRQLLRLAARNRLTDEAYKKLGELVAQAGRVNRPVWLK
jgi:transcriptional regulator with XRE-family HTH domain